MNQTHLRKHSHISRKGIYYNSVKLLLALSIEVIFFQFLWNAGPDRITSKVDIRNLSSGGLRMPHIYSFI